MPLEDPRVQLLSLLDSVADGSRLPVDVLTTFNPPLEQSYCVFNLYEEFRGAFGSTPHRTEALPLLRALAGKIVGYPDDDTSLLFDEPEWASLVALRGPVEGVEMFRCDPCNRAEPRFMLSGFLDLRPATCTMCGEVLFHSPYDQRPLPPCRCGGTFADFSSSCRHCRKPLRRTDQVSGYQYFANHSWTQRAEPE